MVLTFIGGQVVETPYVQVGQIASIVYFAYFLVLNPVAGYLESKIIK